MNENISITEKKNEAYLKQDETKLRMLHDISFAYQNTDPDKSIGIALQAKELAETLDLPFEIAESYKNLSVANKNKGEYDKAIEFSMNALKIYQSFEDDSGIAYNFLELGDICRMKGDFIKSTEHLEKSLELFLSIQNQDGIGRSYSLLGNIFLLTSDYQKSAEYYNKALKIFEQIGDETRLAGSLSNLGGVYYFTGDYPMALEQFQKALKINEHSGNKLWMLANLGNIGNLYFEISEYPKAQEYFQKSLKISEETDNKYGLCSSLASLGSIYEVSLDHEKALEMYQRVLNISIEIDDKLGTGESYMSLSNIYIYLSDYTDAFENLQKALIIFDEIKSADNTATGLHKLALWHIKAPGNTLRSFGIDPDNKYELARENLLKSIDLSERSSNLKIQKDDYMLLSELYENQLDFKKALEAYKKFIEIRDNITGEESKKQITRKEMQYDFDKKESLAKAEQEKKDALALKELQRQKLLRNSFIGGFSTVALFAGVFFTQRNKIREGKKLSDDLLLNILPEEVAEELKAKGSAEAKHFDEVTVMFTDFKGFTQISEKLSPADLVNEIDTCFKAFDNIISKYNIEKIKTIGDSYMCAGGLPVVNRTNATDVVNAALEIQEFMDDHLRERKNSGKEIFEVRIGIHTGPVVAGIVGVKKFAYDIWGNTVNIASRFESSGEAGKVNISSSTYELIKNKFDCTYRGKVEAKNKGLIDMYFVNGVL